jgi:hypothetical protein
MSQGGKKFKVWVEQVNACSFDVVAKDEQEAKEKGYRKWRKEYARSYVTSVEPQDKEG